MPHVKSALLFVQTLLRLTLQVFHILQCELQSCLVLQEGGIGIDAVALETEIEPELDIPTQEAILPGNSAMAAHDNKERWADYQLTMSSNRMRAAQSSWQVFA